MLVREEGKNDEYDDLVIPGEDERSYEQRPLFIALLICLLCGTALSLSSQRISKERGKQADACESGDQWNQTDDRDHDTPNVMDDQEPKSDQRDTYNDAQEPADQALHE